MGWPKDSVLYVERGRERWCTAPGKWWHGKKQNLQKVGTSARANPGELLCESFSAMDLKLNSRHLEMCTVTRNASGAKWRPLGISDVQFV